MPWRAWAIAVLVLAAVGIHQAPLVLGETSPAWPCPTSDLDVVYACLKARMPGAASLGYRPPDGAEAANWTSLAAALLASADCTASVPPILASVVVVVRLDAGGPDADVCVFAEIGDADGDGRSDRGWGGFAFRLGIPSKVHLQAPHPLYDVGTGEQAVGVFRDVGDVRSVAWAGAHRYALSRTGGDGSDMSEARDSVFMATLDALLDEAAPDAAFLSFHGMLDAFCASNVFLTTGQAREASVGEPVLNLRDELRDAHGPGAAVNAYADDPDCSLTGANNVQGMEIRARGRTFIHIESDDAYVERDGTATAVAAADLNAALGGRNPAWPCPTFDMASVYGCLKRRMGQIASTAYVAPDGSQRENWTDLASAVLSTGQCARSLVPPILRGVVEITPLDPGPHGSVCVVAEVEDADLDGHSDRGWGGYAINVTGGRDLHLLAPYPYDHTDSGEHATGMFGALEGGRSVAWAGSHGRAMPATDGGWASDMTQRNETMLMATLEATLGASGPGGVFLSMHALADRACASHIYLTTADGTTPPATGALVALREALAEEYPEATVTAYGDAPSCNLGEMRVAQTSRVTGAGRTFILALANHAYQDGARWASAAEAAGTGV